MPHSTPSPLSPSKKTLALLRLYARLQPCTGDSRPHSATADPLLMAIGCGILWQQWLDEGLFSGVSDLPNSKFEQNIL